MPASNDKKQVAVVTGANRGIGLQIVKNLTQKLGPGFEVLLTSRSEIRGLEAVKQVTVAGKSNTGAQVKFHQLDIDDHKTIESLRNDLQKTYGGLDILVQNGAIFLRDSKHPPTTVAEATLQTNYFGVRDLCRALLPIMRENGRIVLLASRMGDIHKVKCAETRQRLLSNDLRAEELDKIIQNYVDEVKEHSDGQQQESTIWDDKTVQSPDYGAYSASKVGIVALARVLQREADALNKNILVTSVCPGYVDTDMTQHKGEKTVEEGADTPTYLALLKGGDESVKIKGQFLAERAVIDWGSYKGMQPVTSRSFKFFSQQIGSKFKSDPDTYRQIISVSLVAAATYRKQKLEHLHEQQYQVQPMC